MFKEIIWSYVLLWLNIIVIIGSCESNLELQLFLIKYFFTQSIISFEIAEVCIIVVDHIDKLFDPIRGNYDRN